MTQKTPQRPITADEIRAQHEINGARRANTNLLVYALEQLKSGDDRSNVEKVAALTIEREQTVAALRRFAEQCGETAEWTDWLSVAELVERVATLVREREGATKAPEKSKR